MPYLYDFYGPGYGSGYSEEPDDWATVDTGVAPGEARVYLDGRYIGTANDFSGNPDYLYLRPGEYELEFRLEGYEPLSIDVDAKPGRHIEIDEKLHEIPGAKRSRPSEPPQPEGDVFRYWGKPEGAPEPYDDDGDQTPGPRTRASDDDGPAMAAPSPRHTSLLFSVEPADAAIYLDNHFIGIADELRGATNAIPVTPGGHTITVSRPGFKVRTVEIDAVSGESKRVNLSLGK